MRGPRENVVRPKRWVDPRRLRTARSQNQEALPPEAKESVGFSKSRHNLLPTRDRSSVDSGGGWVGVVGECRLVASSYEPALPT